MSNPVTAVSNAVVKVLSVLVIVVVVVVVMGLSVTGNSV